jgi:hypothetical protein
VSAASLDLPFAVPAKEGVKVLTTSMEVAAIFLQAEAKSRKQGLLGAAKASVLFVSKLRYPMWAVPWENRSLIIDGLGVSPSIIVKQQAPDVIRFIEDVERGASVRELFRSALERHSNTFSNFTGRNHVHVDSMIADTELLSAIDDYLREAAGVQKQGEEIPAALAPLKLDLQMAVETAKLVQNLDKQIRSERASLEYARDLLDDTMKLHEQMMLREISSACQIYDDQIAQLKPAVEKRLDHIVKERDSRIAKMNRIKETELKGKESEKTRRERELQKLELSKAGMVRKRETRRQKHDKIGEAHWNHKIRAIENGADEVKAGIRALTAFIEKTNAQAEADAEKVKQDYQWLIDQETRKIRDIETQRDETVGIKQREIDALKLVAKRIRQELDELSARKKEETEELRSLSIDQRFDDVTLLCVPFYLVGYQTEDMKRFHVFSPVKALSAEGVVATIRKKLRDIRAEPRVSLFLQPRSEAVTQMIDSIVDKKMESDKSFSEDLIEAASSHNIMLKNNFKEMLIKGAKELKTEDWITIREEALLKAYT